MGTNPVNNDNEHKMKYKDVYRNIQDGVIKKLSIKILVLFAVSWLVKRNCYFNLLSFSTSFQDLAPYIIDCIKFIYFISNIYVGFLNPFPVWSTDFNDIDMMWKIANHLLMLMHQHHNMLLRACLEELYLSLNEHNVHFGFHVSVWVIKMNDHLCA